MRNFLLTVVLLIFLCPITVQASETEQSYEDYLNEMDWLTENDPTFSFSEQFCKDHGIESYRELDLIINVYYSAMDNGFDSYSDMEDASIAQYIVENEIGEETIDELRELQEEYGYGSIDELLRAVDEIGYYEITGDYSNFSKQTTPANSNPKAEKSATNYGGLILCGIGVISFWLLPPFISEHLKEKRKEKQHGSDKLS